MTEKLRKKLELLEHAAANRKSKAKSSGVGKLTLAELRFAVYFAERCEIGDTTNPVRHAVRARRQIRRDVATAARCHMCGAMSHLRDPELPRMMRAWPKNSASNPTIHRW